MATTRRIDEGPSGPVGIFFMVAYLVGLLYFAPTLLTSVYLVLTVGVIAIVAKIRRDRFRDLILNNDWIVLSVLGMFLVSWIIAALNPLTPRDPIKGAWDTLWGVPRFPSASSFVWGAIWRTINWTFHGAWRTNGWANATGTYFLWLIPAIFVSKWDEALVLVGWVIHSFSEPGWLKSAGTFLVKDGLAEGFWGILRSFFRVVIVTIALGSAVACGPNIDKQLKVLESKSAPTTSEEAKARIDEVVEFEQLVKDAQESGATVPDGAIARVEVLKAKLETKKFVAEIKEGKIWAQIKNFLGFGESVSKEEIEQELTPEKEKKEKEKLEQEKLKKDVDLFGEKPFNKDRWP